MRVFTQAAFRAAIIVTLVLVAGMVGIFIHTMKPVTDLQSAGVKANKLVASVGGPSKICDEANKMFQRFNVTNVKFFYYASELRDYPSIAALGTPDRISIYSGSPPYIAIRVGTHLDGFFIKIIDTNGPGTYVKSAGTLQLGDSCVYVHR